MVPRHADMIKSSPSKNERTLPGSVKAPNLIVTRGGRGSAINWFSPVESSIVGRGPRIGMTRRSGTSAKSSTLAAWSNCCEPLPHCFKPSWVRHFVPKIVSSRMTRSVGICAGDWQKWGENRGPLNSAKRSASDEVPSGCPVARHSPSPPRTRFGSIRSTASEVRPLRRRRLCR
jgi:hypothetical protein